MCEHEYDAWITPEGPTVQCTVCGVRFEYKVRTPTKGQQWLAVSIITADGTPPTAEIIAESNEVAAALMHEGRLDAFLDTPS